MSVGSMCTRVVVTASPTESVLDVARRMDELGVGTVVVVSPAPVPRGILTDRDLLLRCTARELDPRETPVSAVMRGVLRSVRESTSVHQALAVMASAGTRRLVVTGPAGEMVGVLSLDDVLMHLAAAAGTVGTLLLKERPTIAGTGARGWRGASTSNS